MDNSKCLEDDILCICRYEYKYFLNKSHVVGVGLGYKISKGFSTCNKCIKVFVNKKIPECCLCSNDRVPSMYKEIITDVVEIGCIMASSFTQKVRPAIGGFSVSPVVNIEASTMGCLVRDANGTYVLGSNHFLAGENTVPLQTPILQPGIADGGRNPRDVIAKLSKYIPLQFNTATTTPNNYVDCAIARVHNLQLVSPQIAIVGIPRGVHAPALGEAVRKVGRTTEMTNGLISSVGITMLVSYRRGQSVLVNQIATTRMSILGDSGAILLDDAMYALGLLCATADSISLYNPIEAVLDQLDVELVTS